MIIVTTPDISPDALDRIIEEVERHGLRAHVSRGEQRTIVGCIGDDAKLSESALAMLEGVDRVIPVLKPYKLASREYSAVNTAIPFGDPAGTIVGGREIVVIAGPCSVEGREMLSQTAHAVQAVGARMLRGGAFKPRTSPYAFQGMGEEGLDSRGSGELGAPACFEGFGAVGLGHRTDDRAQSGAARGPARGLGSPRGGGNGPPRCGVVRDRCPLRGIASDRNARGALKPRWRGSPQNQFVLAFTS